MYNITTLDIGIKIVTESIPTIRSISFGIWVKVGSQNENQNINGISHFIEHMLFKGTLTRSAKDIAEQMDAIGGQMNAFTSKQFTCYYVKILDTNFDKALEIISDMFLNSTFSENEMAKEKKVIIEEINMYEDTPEELVFEIMNENAWAGSALAYPILGSIKNVESFSHSSIKSYYDENYTSENIIITVAGNFDTPQMINKLKKYFGSLQNKNFNSQKTNEVRYKKFIAVRDKEIEQVHICLGFPGIKNSIEENYSLALLNTILGGGMSSRLYQKIREENGLAYSLFSFNYSYDTVGLFAIYAAINPLKVEKCIEVIIDELKNLKSEPITNLQLAKTKEQLKSSYIISLENSSSRMNALGKSIILYDKILTADEIIERIDEVTLEEIYELIDKIFVFDEISLAGVGKHEQMNLISNYKF